MDSRDGFFLIESEYHRASKKYPPMKSDYEGFAILLEEVLELQEALKRHSHEDMKNEAIQVGAMALRFLIDVIKE